MLSPHALKLVELAHDDTIASQKAEAAVRPVIPLIRQGLVPPDIAATMLELALNLALDGQKKINVLVTCITEFDDMLQDIKTTAESTTE